VGILARWAALRRIAVLLLLLSCCPGLIGHGARAEDGSNGHEIVVFGDSQAQGIAFGLQRLLLEEPQFKVLNRTHPGAAVVHEESEWLAPIRKFLANERADVAIVMLGANDRLDMRDGGSYLRFRSDAWRDEYAKRIDRIMSALINSGLKVIWCGNPIARSGTYSSDMTYINDIYANEAGRFGVQFVPLWSTVVDDGGNYTAFGKGIDGVTQRLRGDDGIHFTAAGYELIADKIVALIPTTPASGQ